MRFIPSYDEAVAICQRNPVFYETKHKVNGYDVSVFNYRLATYDDFRTENAFEMRGLTFVFNTDGTLYKRFLGLHKFFNVNETEITQAYDIKDYEVINVSNKLDGSMITFIELPDGEIVAKTKNAFDADQAIRAKKIYDDDPIIRSFVKEQISKGHCVFFEYTSPLNRIVIKYSVSSLSLTKIRDGLTGEYLFSESVPEGLKMAENETFEFTSLDDLMKTYETLENKEGSVITFRKPDGDQLLVKVKTADYFAKHHIMTEFIYQENVIVEMILNETIDDMLSLIEDAETRERINGLIKITQKKFREEVERAQKFVDIYLEDPTVPAKDLYAKYRKCPGFADALYVINRLRDGEEPNTLEEIIKKRLLKQTYRLMEARAWLGI
jgi:RNA ligase